MHVKKLFLVSTVLIIIIASSSFSYAMHGNNYSWPIFPFLRDDNDVSYTFNKFDVAIAACDFRELYDLRGSRQEMSPMQRLQQKLIEKDSENESIEQHFIVPNSRYVRYVHQREKIIQTCIDSLNSSIDARLSLSNLSYALSDEKDLSDELNVILQEYLTELFANFYSHDGQLKALVDYNAAAKTLGMYLLQFLSWDECLQRVENYAKDNVPGFARFYRDMLSPFKSFKGVKNALEHLMRTQVAYSEFKKRIDINPFNRDLILLKDAYKKSDFKTAFDITEKYKQAKVIEQQKLTPCALKAIDCSNIIARFSRQLIPILEPLKRINAIQQQYETSTIVQCIGACAERSIRYNALHGNQIAPVEYLIQTLHKISKKRKQKNGTITQEFAQAYDAFFDEHGLPTIFSYDQKMVQSLPHMPSGKDDGRYKERMHLFKLAILSKEKRYTENEQFRQALARAVNYFCYALKDKENAQTYLLLSQALYNALTDENSYKTIGDFDFLPSEHKSAIHENLLHHVRALVQTKNEFLTLEQKKFLNKGISALSRVWVKARDDDNQEAQSYIQNPNPLTALAEENLLDVTVDNEQAQLTAQCVYEHSKASGIDALLADNQGSISSSQLRSYETKINKLRNQEYVPRLDTIMHIMHDAHAPKEIVFLLSDALEFWHTVRSQEQREIAATVTDFAEVAYDYHQDGNESYVAMFVGMGRSLLKYAHITGTVVWRNVQRGYGMAHGVVVTSPHAIEYTLKTFHQAAMPLIEGIQRFAFVISGKNFYSPRDYFDQVDLEEMLNDPTTPSRRRLEVQEKIKRFEQSIIFPMHEASIVFSYVAYLVGIDAADLRAMNVETDKAVRAYINKLCAMSNEEKFEHIADFAIDWILWDKVFGLAGRLFGMLQRISKDVINLRKIQRCTSEVEIIEQVAEAVVNGEKVLVKATEESLIPTIMKSEAESIKAGIKSTVDRLSEKIINYMERGEGKVIKDFTSKVFLEQELHIFSPDHVRGGILKLGVNRDNIVEKFADIIINADKNSFIKEGVNTMITQIDNCKVIMKVTVRNGVVINSNGYLWNRPNPKLVGNVFTFIMDKYK